MLVPQLYIARETGPKADKLSPGKTSKGMEKMRLTDVSRKVMLACRGPNPLLKMYDISCQSTQMLNVMVEIGTSAASS